MKGNDKLIASLNKLLAEELTAISEYMVQSEMCDNWGYEKLHKELEKAAMDEMHHAEWLIARIIFLEGLPIVSKLNPLQIGKNVKEMVSKVKDVEDGAIKLYNQTITLAHEVEDQGTVDLLTKIVKDEEEHYDWSDKQVIQIEQMGIQNYLATKVSAE